MKLHGVLGLTFLFVACSGARVGEEEVFSLRDDAKFQIVHRRAFPADIGPYYLLDAGVMGTINVSHHSSEWSVGDAQGELSPKKDIALPQIAESIGLERESIHAVAWAYPDPKYATDAGSTPEAMFKKVGGYIYYDNCNRIVAVKTIVVSSGLLKFGPPEDCIECRFDRCPGANGFMDYREVNIKVYRPYVSHFCWLPPETCERLTSLHRDGCFSFKKAGAEGFLIFPVATEQAQGGFPHSLGPFFLSSTHDQPSNVSQWSPVDLPLAPRMNLGVPEESTGFAWGYGGANLTYGSFVYSPGASVKKILSTEYKVDFGQPAQETMTQADAHCDSTWHKVELKTAFPHAKRYCWSKNIEESFIFEMEDGSIIRFPVSVAQP